MKENIFHKTHPYTFVFVLQFTIFIVAILSGVVTKRFGLPIYMLYGIMMATLSLITAIILWKMNGWKDVGFRKLHKKHLYLLIVPALPLLGNTIGHYKAIDVELYVYYLFLNIMVGFVEEGMYRGLMLRALLQKGIWLAAFVPSTLFSLSHSMNLLAGWPWQYVMLQLIYSFAIGFGWAAFAIRTKTIWPLMLIHGFGNYLSFIKSEDLIKTLQSSEPGLEGMISTAFFTIVFMIYGIVVLRSHMKKEMGFRTADDASPLKLAY